MARHSDKSARPEPPGQTVSPHHGEPVDTSETITALLTCLYGRLGQVVPYNQLGAALGYRRIGLRRAVLRQYVYVLERLLAEHKAPYTVTVARNVGYALCQIAAQNPKPAFAN